MIKIQSGDTNLLTVVSTTDYSFGNTGVAVTIDLTHEVKDLIWQLRSITSELYDLREMHKQWLEERSLIQSNLAVQNSYEQFKTMAALAKEVKQNEKSL